MNTTYFTTPENAAKIVEQLNADSDDSWVYGVNTDNAPAKQACIEVYDEANDFMGYFYF